MLLSGTVSLLEMDDREGLSSIIEYKSEEPV
jgi:hypothetical protein